MILLNKNEYQWEFQINVKNNSNTNRIAKLQRTIKSGRSLWMTSLATCNFSSFIISRKIIVASWADFGFIWKLRHC